MKNFLEHRFVYCYQAVFHAILVMQYRKKETAVGSILIEYLQKIKLLQGQSLSK